VIAYTVTVRGPMVQGASAGVVDRAVSAALTELGHVGQALVVKRTPAGVSSGGGGLRGSIFTEQRGRGVQRTQLIASSVAYAPFVELGRQPGRRPPIGPILLWVRRKLQVAPQQEQRVAFLVARKIGAVGYRGYGMFQHAATQLQPIVQRRFQKLAADLSAQLGGGR